MRGGEAVGVHGVAVAAGTVDVAGRDVLAHGYHSSGAVEGFTEGGLGLRDRGVTSGWVSMGKLRVAMVKNTHDCDNRLMSSCCWVCCWASD